MDGKIKLLWVGDSPASSTGFGRVSQATLENLYQTGKYEISVLGINHTIGDPHRYEGMFRIYPSRSKGDVYGFNRVEEVITKERPDVILINNDLWIVGEYVKLIPKDNRIVTYSPVDALPVQDAWLKPIEKVGAKVVVYTEFAKAGVLKAKNIDSIEIIGHGVDTDEFYPVEDARKFLANIPQDAFVIQNVNRNQPRKRLDLFLKAMQLFLSRLPESDRKNVLFYYHGTMRDVGWNLVALAQRWGIDDRFLITDQRNMNPAQGVTLPMLNKIYNCADVHVLTSMGEGFGLSPFESAACGVAQVVPDHSACSELWNGIAPLIKIKDWEVLTGGINTEGGVIDIEHLADILNDLYFHREKVKELGKKAYEFASQERFSWSYVAHQFDNVLNTVLSSDSYLSKKYIEEDKPQTIEEEKVPVAGEAKHDNNISADESN